MLAKIARVTTADDYRAAVRRGARFGAPNTVTYVRQSGSVVRFGFIVSKQVGVAVTRNRVRRRLKAVCYEVLPQMSGGVDVVIRALPGAASASFGELKTEVVRSLTRARSLTAGEADAAELVVR